ncbi:MAG: MGMT family protein [Opitutaceae bacterium]|nr:MGMT family protein [Opitutaceae bacterium]
MDGGLLSAAARAVGAALGRNPWPLLAPSYRVSAANGAMTGRSAPGDIGTKSRLFALEGAELRLE